MPQYEMKKLIAYNEWAWQRVFPNVAQLSVAAYKADRGFFWGSIHGMLTHCFSAEWIWPLRIQGTNPTTLRDPADFADFNALRVQWDVARQKLAEYISGLTEADLARVYTYRNTAGREYAVTVGETLRHVFLHSAEHRGQITPVLFQLGVPTEPLDYIFFARSVVAE